MHSYELGNINIILCIKKYIYAQNIFIFKRQKIYIKIIIYVLYNTYFFVIQSQIQCKKNGYVIQKIILNIFLVFIKYVEKLVILTHTKYRLKCIFEKVLSVVYTFLLDIFRHDGCLLPWVRHIQSIPVIWVGNPKEEVYAFESTGVALPMLSGGLWARFWTRIDEYFLSYTAKNSYHSYILRLVAKYLPNINADIKDDYSDVRLVLWGADTILRSNFAPLTQLLVEVRQTNPIKLLFFLNKI